MPSGSDLGRRPKMKTLRGVAMVDENGDITFATREALPWVCVSKAAAMREGMADSETFVDVEVRAVNPKQRMNE